MATEYLTGVLHMNPLIGLGRKLRLGSPQRPFNPGSPSLRAHHLCHTKVFYTLWLNSASSATLGQVKAGYTVPCLG